jgi:Na+/alanine symporter
MWAQVVPTFQLIGKFQAALPSVYGGATANGVNTAMLYEKAIDLYNQGLGKTAAAGEAIASLGITANPTAQGVVAILSIAINVICIAEIIKRSVKLGKNPYANEVFVGTKDFDLAMERAEV